MRACQPSSDGYLERDGVKLYYEVFGTGDRTVLLMPTWQVVYSRLWKAQVPYLARHFRVVTFDARGNGRSDRPSGPEHYADTEIVDDTVAVLDATGTDRAVAAGFSMGGWWSTRLAAEHPERVAGLVLIAPMCLLEPLPLADIFADPLPVDEGWAKFNQHYFRRDFPGFIDFFFSQLYTEPHSTKQFEDSVGWGLETTPEVLIAESHAPWPDEATLRGWCAAGRCPVLVVHGDDDQISPVRRGRALAEATGGALVVLEGAGHIPMARDPVKVNRLIREFAESLPAGGPG